MKPAHLLSLILLPLLAGCGQLTYYGQAVSGQLALISKRQPLDEVVADPATPESLRSQLQLAARMRKFASDELGLPDNRTFDYYADLGRRYAVWNVVAAPALSLTPRTWCFPVAGCVAYKGFFAEEDARELDRKLQSEGYDTFRYGVSAYSTLGRFSDPLLNTFIDYPEPYLASLIFHELAHQQVYVKDDSDFNEAFATAVELEGLRRWLQQNPASEEQQPLLARVEAVARINNVILARREELVRLYESSANDTDKTAGKAKIIEGLKSDYRGLKESGHGTPYHDWLFEQPINNAYLVSVSTYHRLVPAFTELLAQQDGSLGAFYHEVQVLGRLDRDLRDTRLEALGASARVEQP